MTKQNQIRTRPSPTARRETARIPWTYFIVIALCGTLLAAGFFLAGGQHFASIELGMKNSELREQLKAIETENRRLILAREVALSPVEIKRTARSLGFVEHTTGNDAVVLASATPRPSVDKRAPKQPGVIATSYQRPVTASGTDTAKKPVTGERKAELSFTAMAKLR
jgi:hypothetical protein